jgi:hypothetical protein
MDDETFKPFNWQLPLYGALAAIFVLLPKMLFGNDAGAFLLTVLLGATVCVVLLIVVVLKIRRQIVSSLLMLVVFGAVSFVFLTMFAPSVAGLFMRMPTKPRFLPNQVR